jgi:anti-sigma factor RsiW
MNGPIHLSEEQIQGLADGTLRGPEGFAAREHADQCDDCTAELAMFSALTNRLNALADPPVPVDFTSSVLSAVEARERMLLAKRHTVLAAIPAGLVGVIAVVGWALSAAPSVHIDRFLEAWSVGRLVVSAATPVLQTLRIPIGLGAFAFAAAVIAVLTRALRRGDEPSPASF